MTGLPAALQRTHARHMLHKAEATEKALNNRVNFLENELKHGHPWTNRTGDAEKSLGVAVDVKKNGLQTTFTMRIGYIKPPRVKYGIHLENARAGAFAVVKPLVKRYAPIIAIYVRAARKAS